MCGIAGMFGRAARPDLLHRMVRSQHHRGPDTDDVWASRDGAALLGHNRLSIIDLSTAGRQPMTSASGRLTIAFNGEIYNYVELRSELSDYPFRTKTDTEVVLAAYERWGAACLDRFVGMFAFLLWDGRDHRLFAARDRFGVKPLYYVSQLDGSLALASEIKALFAAGVPARPDEVTWATYLAYGLHDHSPRTFWEGVQALPPGHTLTWRDGHTTIARWYNLAERAGAELDARPESVMREEYAALLRESVRLRFRSDVPAGICLSGGLDSSVLLGTVQAVQGAASDVTAFTFVTGDPAYDELRWVRETLARTRHPLEVCMLRPDDVPALAASVQAHEDEPFGGLPTLAYARLFERARERGVLVLLDGQGMDEQWAGYDYYERVARGEAGSVVQGSAGSPVRPACLAPGFRALAEPMVAESPFPDALRNRQCRDVRHIKLPRALRFNDRASMRASVELREPFLDHRLVELALRQPEDRKLRGTTRKRLLREIAAEFLPNGVVEAPKRPVQTPQREWLRGPLCEWAGSRIEEALDRVGGTWLDVDAVRAEWRGYVAGEGDNSFFVWQWVSLGMLMSTMRDAPVRTSSGWETRVPAGAEECA